MGLIGKDYNGYSYLTDRNQAVWVDHVFSKFLQCDVGDPQADQEKVVNPSNLVASRIIGWQ